MKQYYDYLKKIEDFIFIEDTLEKADVIVVPGNRYAKNAENAAKLYTDGYAPLVIPSGRYAKNVGTFEGVLDEIEKYTGLYHTEGEFLTEVLCRNGVPEEAILTDHEATFTYENALYTKKLLDKKQIIPEKGIICCRNTHARRCYMYFKTVFPDTKWMICPSVIEDISKENWRKTQAGIELVMGEATRVITQFELWMKDPDR